MLRLRAQKRALDALIDLPHAGGAARPDAVRLAAAGELKCDELIRLLNRVRDPESAGWWQAPAKALRDFPSALGQEFSIRAWVFSSESLCSIARTGLLRSIPPAIQSLAYPMPGLSV